MHSLLMTGFLIGFFNLDQIGLAQAMAEPMTVFLTAPTGYNVSNNVFRANI